MDAVNLCTYVYFSACGKDTDGSGSISVKLHYRKYVGTNVSGTASGWIVRTVVTVAPATLCMMPGVWLRIVVLCVQSCDSLCFPPVMLCFQGTHRIMAKFIVVKMFPHARRTYSFSIP